MERKVKAATQTGIYLTVVAAILIAGNVISYGFYKRFDTTKSDRFTLSKGSKRLVREELKQQLQVDVYITRGLPKFDAFINDLSDLLGEYERASEGKMHYTLIEAKTEEQRAAAKEAGLQESAFGEGSKTGETKATFSRGFMGMSFKYGSEKEAIPVMNPDQSQGLEFWITNKIREIHDRADDVHHKIGILTGKDEIKLSDANLVATGPGRGQGPTLKGILQQAFPFYQFEDVDLQSGEAEINKELVGLIVTQPGKDFTEKELRRVDQFVMLGKSLVVFASAVNMKASDAAMKADLNLHGLDKLFEGYGVEMKKDAIVDWGRPLVMRVQTQGQAALIPHFGIVQAQYDSRLDAKEQVLDQSFPGFFRMDEVAFPFPSSLVPHPEKQDGCDVHAVARTSLRATVVTTDTFDEKSAMTRDLQPSGEYAQRAIAVAVEGKEEGGTRKPCKMKSAYGGKEGQGITAPAESAPGARVLLISSSQFLANPFARQGNAPPMPPQMQMMGGIGGDEDLQLISQFYAQQYLTETIIAFKNIVDWMSGDTDLIAVSAKLLSDPNLTYRDIQRPEKAAATDPEAVKKQSEEYEGEVNKVQQRVQWTLTLFPAALFALLGILRWRLRESARANIRID